MCFLWQSVDLNLNPWPPPFDLTLPRRLPYCFMCIRFCKQGSTEHDSVTNRVAGFICKHVFTEHSSCVTGLAVVGREAGYNTTYLVRFTCNVKYVTMLKLRRARLLISTLFSRMKQLEVLLLPLLIHHRLTPPPTPARPQHFVIRQSDALPIVPAGRKRREPGDDISDSKNQ